MDPKSVDMTKERTPSLPNGVPCTQEEFQKVHRFRSFLSHLSRGNPKLRGHKLAIAITTSSLYQLPPEGGVAVPVQALEHKEMEDEVYETLEALTDLLPEEKAEVLIRHVNAVVCSAN